MTSKNTGPGPRKDRRARFVQEKRHDPYMRRRKAPGAFVCDRCGVVHHGGRWRWCAPPPAEVHGGLCPACERIRDDYPAGTIHVAERLCAGRDELLNLVRNSERLEREEHPLERLMGVESDEEGLFVTTTGIHLARRIASQLERALGEKPQIRYPDGEHHVVVEWKP